MHIAKRIDVDHKADRGDDYEHHCRYRVDHEAKVEMQVAERQPCEVEWHYCRISSISTAWAEEIAERRDIREHCDDTQRRGADESSHLVRHLHTCQSQDHKGEERQKKYEKNITIFHNAQLEFQVLNTVHLVAVEAVVNIDYYRYSHCSLSSTHSDGKERHEEALKLVRVKQTVESCEIDVNGIEHKLNGDEHSYQVAAGYETEDADKEQKC